MLATVLLLIANCITGTAKYVAFSSAKTSAEIEIKKQVCALIRV